MTSAGPHILLIGMMATGKTTLLAELAARLAWPAIDLDTRLQARHHMPAGALLALAGETAFRRLEAAALAAALAAPGPSLIACGGGVLTRVAGRRAAATAALTVWLRAQPATLAARLRRQPRSLESWRPLLPHLGAGARPQPRPRAGAGTGLEQRLAALVRQRSAAYAAAADLAIDTDLHTAAALAEQVARIIRRRQPTACLRMQLPALAASRPGWAQLVAGSFSPLAQDIAAAGAGRQVALVCDDRLTAGPGRKVATALRRAGLRVSLHPVPPGERAKTGAVAQQLVGELLAAGLGRQDSLVALGGGAIGDLTGFVASIYLRGVAWSFLPTTSLAAIDASIGGKTAINLPAGKNLVGSLWPARAVWVHRQLLARQPARVWAAGWVEAIKIAALLDADLYADIVQEGVALRHPGGDIWPSLMARAMALKAALVAGDMRDHGRRNLLNLGHTLGHGIEAGHRYRILHGQAVAWGMLAEAHLAGRRGWGPRELEGQLEAAFSALGLSVAWRCATFDRQALALDKKRRGDHMVLPVVERLGHGILAEVSMAMLVGFARRTWTETS